MQKPLVIILITTLAVAAVAHFVMNSIGYDLEHHHENLIRRSIRRTRVREDVKNPFAF